MSTIYLCKNVTFRYPDATIAVKDVDLEIEEAITTAVVGVTGSGKSTLLMLLGGLLRPSSGEIYYKGFSLSDYSRFREEVGILMQNPYNQFLNTTVFDEIAYAPRQLGWNEGDVEEIVYNIAKKLDITHLLDKSPFKVSGGEARRIGIAMTIAHSPQTILLDEPYVDLSENHINRVKDLLRELRDEGKTIIYTSNSLDHVIDLAEKIFVISGGRVVWSGAVDDVEQCMDYFIEEGIGYPLYLRIYHELGLKGRYPMPRSSDELISLLSNLIREQV